MPDIVDVRDVQLTPVGSQFGLDASAATGLTVPDLARYALIQTLDQNLRWRDDGTAPDASTGMQLSAGESLFYTGDLDAIQLIEEAATAAVNVVYYR